MWAAHTVCADRILYAVTAYCMRCLRLSCVVRILYAVPQSGVRWLHNALVTLIFPAYWMRNPHIICGQPHVVCGTRILYAGTAYCMRRPNLVCGDRISYAGTAYCMRLPHTMIFAVFCIQGPEECARVRELRDLIAQESKLHAYLTAPIHVHPLHCAPPCSQLYSSTCH